MSLIRDIARERNLTVLCSLHQVDLALSWADRIIGLREGAVVLDTPTAGLGRAEVMEIYGKVAVDTEGDSAGRSAAATAVAEPQRAAALAYSGASTS